MSIRKNLGTRWVATAAALLLAASAQAGLLNADTGFGTGTAVLDEATGKTWLSFRVQSGQSFEQFSPLLGTGNYTDFRLASNTEVTQLLGNHTSGFANTASGISAAFGAFVSLFGPTLRDGLTGTGCELEMTAITSNLLPDVQVFPRSVGPSGARASGSHGIAGFGVRGRTDNSVPCFGPTQFTNESLFGGRLSLDVIQSRYIVFREPSGFNYQALYGASGFNPVLPFNDFDLSPQRPGCWVQDC
jgi:hypothetical protein